MRSESLVAAALVVEAAADLLRAEASRVAGAVAALGPPPLGRGGAGWGGVGWGDIGWGGVGSVGVGFGDLWVAWVRLEGRVVALVGPGGLWGQALLLDALALDLRAAARVYAEVEAGVAAVIAGVARGADAAGRGGWLDDGPGPALVRLVEPTLSGPVAVRSSSLTDLVGAGDGLGGGRVRVLETVAPGGGSAWVVVVPGTQEWSPRAGSNPFDLTTDVRAVTGDATVAAAGVAAAVDLARSRSTHSRAGDPVLLVGHSQGGILAAALAADAGFARRHRVTHLVTSGAPVGLFPVPDAVRVLSVQHADDPVHRLDLTPNPTRSSWVTLEAPPAGVPVDVRRHALESHVRTLRTVEEAPRGTVAGLDAFRATTGAFVAVPVRSVTEVVVSRPPGGPEGVVADSPP
ncbi:hypothetical protein [Oryzobacter terrae]|uniref:hypothetical protein n=1 Tax=Oryzobacter terrae TaxID=1620385 RepID=UPI00366B83E9